MCPKKSVCARDLGRIIFKSLFEPTLRMRLIKVETNRGSMVRYQQQGFHIIKKSNKTLPRCNILFEMSAPSYCHAVSVCLSVPLPKSRSLRATRVLAFCLITTRGEALFFSSSLLSTFFALTSDAEKFQHFNEKKNDFFPVCRNDAD